MVRSAVLPDFFGGNGSSCCAREDSGSKLTIAISKCIAGEFFITISDFIVIGLALKSAEEWSLLVHETKLRVRSISQEAAMAPMA